jgi:signal transduction histidine kinase
VSAPEKLDIRHTVAGVLPDIQTLADAGGQHLVVEIPEGQVCLADLKMLKKVLSNVLLNAVQNTPKGGEVRIGSKPLKNHHRLCVLNTGTRIDEGALPMLLDPFYREDEARSKKNGGGGLGLTIVKKTLDGMDIDFALENTPDGVLFWMDVPKEHRFILSSCAKQSTATTRSTGSDAGSSDRVATYPLDSASTELRPSAQNDNGGLHRRIPKEQRRHGFEA